MVEVGGTCGEPSVPRSITTLQVACRSDPVRWQRHHYIGNYEPSGSNEEKLVSHNDEHQS